ncbi:MAG: class I SAM-dependent methyltransferase [Candidatus Aminicenantes bacterium]|nr:class I SAM-dependent methyltransferase [Candidatus Aminicenantes bacterium]
MKEEPWQLQIFNKSIKKKEKLRLLEQNLTIDPSSVILDLGCAQGILSYFLRRKGGYWISTDLDMVNLKTSINLLKSNCMQLGPGILPFKSEAFDLVVSLDYLEHLDDDDQCLREIHRVLKQDGRLIMATPHTGRIFLVNRLRPLLGLKLEMYGHKREGYSLKDLQSKLGRAGLQVEANKTFSHFFSEFIELGINFLYIKLFSKEFTDPLRDGHIRPTTAEEFGTKKKTFKLYALIYPLMWLISRMDKLLFFQKGYSLLVWAKKTTRS